MSGFSNADGRDKRKSRFSSYSLLSRTRRKLYGKSVNTTTYSNDDTSISSITRGNMTLPLHITTPNMSVNHSNSLYYQKIMNKSKSRICPSKAKDNAATAINTQRRIQSESASSMRQPVVHEDSQINVLMTERYRTPGHTTNLRNTGDGADLLSWMKNLKSKAEATLMNNRSEERRFYADISVERQNATLENSVKEEEFKKLGDLLLKIDNDSKLGTAQNIPKPLNHLEQPFIEEEEPVPIVNETAESLYEKFPEITPEEDYLQSHDSSVHYEEANNEESETIDYKQANNVESEAIDDSDLEIIDVNSGSDNYDNDSVLIGGDDTRESASLSTSSDVNSDQEDDAPLPIEPQDENISEEYYSSEISDQAEDVELPQSYMAPFSLQQAKSDMDNFERNNEQESNESELGLGDLGESNSLSDDGDQIDVESYSIEDSDDEHDFEENIEENNENTKLSYHLSDGSSQDEMVEADEEREFDSESDDNDESDSRDITDVEAFNDEGLDLEEQAVEFEIDPTLIATAVQQSMEDNDHLIVADSDALNDTASGNTCLPATGSQNLPIDEELRSLSSLSSSASDAESEQGVANESVLNPDLAALLEGSLTRHEEEAKVDTKNISSNLNPDSILRDDPQSEHYDRLQEELKSSINSSHGDGYTEVNISQLKSSRDGNLDILEHIHKQSTPDGFEKRLNNIIQLLPQLTVADKMTVETQRLLYEENKIDLTQITEVFSSNVSSTSNNEEKEAPAETPLLNKNDSDIFTDGYDSKNELPALHETAANLAFLESRVIDVSNFENTLHIMSNDHGVVEEVTEESQSIASSSIEQSIIELIDVTDDVEPQTDIQPPPESNRTETFDPNAQEAIIVADEKPQMEISLNTTDQPTIMNETESLFIDTLDGLYAVLNNIREEIKDSDNFNITNEGKVSGLISYVGSGNPIAIEELSSTTYNNELSNEVKSEQNAIEKKPTSTREYDDNSQVSPFVSETNDENPIFNDVESLDHEIADNNDNEGDENIDDVEHEDQEIVEDVNDRLETGVIDSVISVDNTSSLGVIDNITDGNEYNGSLQIDEPSSQEPSSQEPSSVGGEVEAHHSSKIINSESEIDSWRRPKSKLDTPSQNTEVVGSKRQRDFTDPQPQSKHKFRRLTSFLGRVLSNSKSLNSPVFGGASSMPIDEITVISDQTEIGLRDAEGNEDIKADKNNDICLEAEKVTSPAGSTDANNNVSHEVESFHDMSSHLIKDETEITAEKRLGGKDHGVGYVTDSSPKLSENEEQRTEGNQYLFNDAPDLDMVFHGEGKYHCTKEGAASNVADPVDIPVDIDELHMGGSTLGNIVELPTPLESKNENTVDKLEIPIIGAEKSDADDFPTEPSSRAESDPMNSLSDETGLRKMAAHRKRRGNPISAFAAINKRITRSKSSTQSLPDKNSDLLNSNIAINEERTTSENIDISGYKVFGDSNHDELNGKPIIKEQDASEIHPDQNFEAVVLKTESLSNDAISSTITDSTLKLDMTEGKIQDPELIENIDLPGEQVNDAESEVPLPLPITKRITRTRKAQQGRVQKTEKKSQKTRGASESIISTGSQGSQVHITMKTRSGRYIGANTSSEIASAEEQEKFENKLISEVASGDIKANTSVSDVAQDYDEDGIRRLRKRGAELETIFEGEEEDEQKQQNQGIKLNETANSSKKKRGLPKKSNASLRKRSKRQ